MDDPTIIAASSTDGSATEVALLRLALMEERRRREYAEQLLSVVTASDHSASFSIDAISRRQSEARFRAAFENSSVGMALSELEGRFVLVNQALCSMLGYSESELLNMSGSDIVHPDHRAEHFEARRRMVAGGIDHFEAEKRYLRKDGRIIWGIGNIALVRDDEGFPINVIGQLQDVTERKAAEDALRASEARLRAIIDHSPTAIFLRDMEGRYLLANTEYERRNGFAPGTVVGRTVHELFPRERADYFINRDRSIFEMGQLTQREGHVVLSGGGSMTTLILRFPVPGPDGRIHAVGAVSTNITERKLAEEALKASEARLRAVMDNCPAAVCIRNRNGRVILSNREFDRRRGLPASKVIGAHVYDFWPKEHADTILAADRAVLASGRVSATERTVVFADGQSRTTLIVRFPIQHEGGEIESLGIISTDITEVREAEAKLRQQQMELAHVYRLNIMGEMATGLAHELNQPLAAIMSYSQGCVHRLHTGTESPEELIEAMEKVIDQATRAGDIINWMRGFVRKGGDEKSPTDLNVLLSEAIDVISHEVVKHKILLELDLSPQHLIIGADRTQIQQVALNLIRNAIEAMHATPSAHRKLVLRSRADDGLATVTVIDHGPGIPEAYRDRLFDPFFTTKQDGLGMGLSICRTIIEDHGGRLSVDSSNGQGTTFRFVLPLRAEVPARPATLPLAEASADWSTASS